MHIMQRYWLTIVAGALGNLCVLAGQTTNFRFVSWGDTKDGTIVLSRLSDQVTALSTQPAFTVYVGDCVSAGFDLTTMSAWRSALDGELTGGRASDGIFSRTFAVRGNHDSRNLERWQSFFNFASVASRVGARKFQSLTANTSYAFDYGNSRFIGLDAPGNAQTVTRSEVGWLDARLTEAEGLGLTHAFIFFHGPIYCVDGHCSCTNDRTCISQGDNGPVTNIINKHPIVTATFHGHEHVQAHVYLDHTRMTLLAPGRSFHEFVTAGAGASIGACEAGRTDYCLEQWGFETVDVNGPAVTVSFYQDGISTPQQTVTFTKTTGGGIRHGDRNRHRAGGRGASPPAQ